MSVTYSEILRKVDSGEVDILSGVVRSKLGKEYPMDELEGVVIARKNIDRELRVDTNIMKYRPGQAGEVLLDTPNVWLEVHLKVLDIKDGELTTKYRRIGDFPSGSIAMNLSRFKEFVSAARNDAYLRLQVLKRRRDLYKKLRDDEQGIIFFGSEDSPYIFKVNLYDELEYAAKMLFGSY